MRWPGRLARAHGDEGLRRRLIAGGRTVAGRHRWDAVVRRLAEEYELAREFARPVARPPVSPLSAAYRKAHARVAAARTPRATDGPPPGDAQHITVVRPGRLGDLLLADPLLAALAERHPGARLELVTDTQDRVPPWMLDTGLAHATLALRHGPDAWRRPGEPERRASLAALTARWRPSPPDVVLFAVDLTDPVYRGLTAELAAAVPHAWRAGLVRNGGRLRELHASVAPEPPGTHESERPLRLAAAAGASGGFRLPRLPAAPSPLRLGGPDAGCAPRCVPFH